MNVVPIWKPYADGTSGQQGDGSLESEPSRRALMPVVYSYVASAGKIGYTSAELRNIMKQHHGKVSGALSNLHRSGSIVRLREKRGRSGIYVLPKHVDGRETVPVRSNKKAGSFEDVVERLEDLLEEIGPTGNDSHHWDECWMIHTPCFGQKIIKILQGQE